MLNFGKLIGHFKKAPGVLHTQANINPGEQPFSCLALWPALTVIRYICLFSPWAMWLPKVGVFLVPLPTWWCMASAFTHSLFWEYTNLWPSQLQGPWREPEMIAVWKLSFLDVHLAPTCGFQVGYFKMEQELWTLSLVLVLLSTFGLCLGFAEDMSFEMGSLPFSQISWNLNKTAFLFQPQVPFEFGCCSSRQKNPPFLFGNKSPRKKEQITWQNRNRWLMRC